MIKLVAQLRRFSSHPLVDPCHPVGKREEREKNNSYKPAYEWLPDSRITYYYGGSGVRAGLHQAAIRVYSQKSELSDLLAALKGLSYTRVSLNRTRLNA